MKNFLRKCWVFLVEGMADQTSEQYAKLWSAALAMVLLGIFTLFPKAAQFVCQLAMATVIFIGCASFVVHKTFGKVERLAVLDNFYIKLGEWLDKMYSDKEKDDVPSGQRTRIVGSDADSVNED